MKPYRSPFLVLVALVLSACAGPRDVATPAPRPTAPATTAVGTDTAAVAAEPVAPDVTAAPVETEASTSGAPARWWLADSDSDAPGAGVLRAYRELLADRPPKQTVVVGVIDSGVEVAHEDLDDNLWVNEDEVPGNGVDDDGNGYVDDIHGWNFIGGPDGRNVDRDTYEVTRLYAACQVSDVTAGSNGAGADSCAEVESAFEDRVRETEQQLERIRFMETAVAGFYGLLRRELGTDSLTAERVRRLTPLRQEVRQAQQAFFQLDEAGITQPMIEEERQRLEDLLEYGLNPGFDPRPIVGDDYHDVSERHYGNPDVTGPDASHGTGVAGIIAGERDNGIGEDGIAPSARIMVLRAVPDGDERDKDVANAIRYAVDNGAQIINMSFGKGHSPWKSAVDDAVRYAEEKGVLLIHAAGNEGEDVDESANFPNRYYADGGEASNWIEVGATGWHGPDRLAAEFTNYGRTRVDVFAPGVDIYTTDTGNAFQTNSGTSFAAPVVSGLAALIMAYYPELDASEVRRAILDSAVRYDTAHVLRPGTDGGTVPFGQLSVTGAVVDAYAALQRAEELARERR